MKPIEKLRQAVLDYESESGEYIEELFIKDRISIGSKGASNILLSDFELILKTRSFK